MPNSEKYVCQKVLSDTQTNVDLNLL